MIIAAHIQQTNGSPSFLLRYIANIAAEQTSVQFLLFCEVPVAIDGLPDNCKKILIKRPPGNSLLLHYWLSYTLPGLLKKYRANLFLSENNTCSLRTTVPQIMLVKQDFLAPTPGKTKTIHKRYLKKYFSTFIAKAAVVCTTHPSLVVDLGTRYPILKDKISTIFHGLSDTYRPIDAQQQVAIQEQYAQGFNFFVCECNAANRTQLVTVLKAFSIFKKRLKSSLQLVLINQLNENPIPDFHLYKYRNEVQLLPASAVHNQAGIIAAAYAGIEISDHDALNDWGLQCMACQVPLLTVESNITRELYHDAVAYTHMEEKTLADKLMLLYKDETFRSLQMDKGIKTTAPYNWSQSSRLLWQSILQCSKV